MTDQPTLLDVPTTSRACPICGQRERDDAALADRHGVEPDSGEPSWALKVSDLAWYGMCFAQTRAKKYLEWAANPRPTDHVQPPEAIAEGRRLGLDVDAIMASARRAEAALADGGPT